MSTTSLLGVLVVMGLGLYPAAQTQAQGPIITGRAEVPAAEAVALQTSADLALKDVGLGGAGQIVFTLQNRGEVSINGGGGKYDVHNRNISTPPIRIDVYLGGAMIQSVYQQAIGAKQARAFSVGSGPTVPKCGETRTIKIVVDPQNVIPELHDNNNSADAIAPRPCPDLAVQSITRVSTGIAGETYSVKVTVINKGTAAAPPSEVWGTSMTTAPGLNGWPEMVPMHPIPALAPGETASFRIGGSVVTGATSWVRVFLDINRLIEESDETNNLVDKKL